MTPIFHFTTPVVARVGGFTAGALRQLFTRHGAPYSQRNTEANSHHFFALPDIIAYLKTHRTRGRLDVAALIAQDREYRTRHGLCSGGVWLGSLKVSRSRAIIATLTEAERVRLAYLTRDFNHGLVMAFWNKVASIDPSVRECIILHPDMYAAVLGDESHGLPQTPEKWAEWAATYAIANSDANTITALAA
jgi:hypothetical protein